MIAEAEPDAALGNGGLGRLAACFMDSMASLAIPAQGYGIRYEHGLFRQLISNGWQEEFPEHWLESGNPWEFERTDVVYDIHYGGHILRIDRPDGTQRIEWVPDETIEAVAFDTPIVGWRGRHVNALRLWSARAVDPLKLETFNRGDHLGAMSEMARAEAISKFLYPSDESPAGKELRLRQEYFFVSASLQDIIDCHLRSEGSVRTLATRAAIQLNDTHPSLAVPELIRMLIDKYNVSWSEAREISQADDLVHEPHAFARGAGIVAGRPVRTNAAAPPRDHLPDQRREPGGRGSACARRCPIYRLGVADR